MKVHNRAWGFLLWGFIAAAAVHGQDFAGDVGTYQLELRTATNALFNEFYTSSNYPLHVVLDTKIYSEVNVPSLTGDVVVLLDRLFATSTDNRNDTGRFELVKDRCAIDSAVQFFSSPTDKFRFSFDMFAFTTDLNRLFLHADTFLCHRTSLDTRCTNGCQGDRLTRVRKDLSSDGHSPDFSNSNYQLVMGPFIKSELVHAHDGSATPDSKDSDYTLIACGFLVAFTLVGAFLYVECRVMRARLASSAKTGLDSEIIKVPAKKPSCTKVPFEDDSS